MLSSLEDASSMTSGEIGELLQEAADAPLPAAADVGTWGFPPS